MRRVPSRVRRGCGALAAAAVATVTVGGLTAFAPAADVAIRTTEQRVPVGAEPDGTKVEIDTRVYATEGGDPRPAILLAHGFGGSKEDLDGQAREYAREGFVVLTWSARGFGASGGRIHLDSPDYEVKDAEALVDVLAKRSDVRQDASGDPRVGVAGGSYGGAIGLMLAGADPRVDAVVSAITWNDLGHALFPQSAVGDAAPGPYKQLWGSRFFASSLAGSQAGGSGGGAGAGGAPGGANALCGRFDPTLCRLLQQAAVAGRPSPALLTLLSAASPQPTIRKITAPTLLVQGEADSLFGLDQADANAAGLAAAGTRHAVRWTDGGHDGPSSNPGPDAAAGLTWMKHYLGGNRTDPLPVPAFSWSLPIPRRADVAPLATSDRYPGLRGDLSTLGLGGSPNGAFLLNPPGGQPSSMTSIPGLGSSLGSLPTYRLAALPGSSTAFDTATIPEAVTVAGSPRVELEVASTGTESTLFVSLWQVQGTEAIQPRLLTAPVRVALTPGTPTKVTVDLQPSVWSLAAGSRWRVLVTTTDNAFAGPREARADRVRLAAPTLSLPTLTGTPVATTTARDNESLGVAAAILALLALVAGSAFLRRRRATREHVREDYADVPLVVDSLVKTYSDGHRAVDDVSWRAERGQVVGLLGPNGAGKTTTIRMLLGLITPDSGEVHVLGHPVHAGSTVLRRVGSLVEGPGFLPHLTGRQNLRAYWAATGRPESEAALDEAVGVAALGGALDRPVRTYSHGMKQRLGIAQAMLGKPEVLFLDEPTNGLDPPQIAAMRPILQSYAASGRTVVVSSHLLAEVELTCSHVVVMNAGRVVTAGTVADLIASEDTTVFELASVADLRTARSALEGADGIRSVEAIDDPTKPTVTVVADRPRAEVVRAVIDAGADVVGVGSRRHLEEVFLGVIASSSGGDDDTGGSTSVIERLRQVRAR